MSNIEKKFNIVAERDYRRARIEITMTHATHKDIQFLIDVVKEFRPYWHECKEEKEEKMQEDGNKGERTISFESTAEEPSSAK